MKHTDLSYTQHWFRAIKMSIALFIHAWIPSILEHYVSDKIKEQN